MTMEPDNGEALLQQQMAAIGTRHRVGVYGWVPDGGGVNYFRVTEPLRVLGMYGNNVSHGRLLTGDILSTVDTVLGHTIHTERDSEAWANLARIQSHRLVMDVDDWLWNADYAPLRGYWRPEVVDRLMTNIRMSHVVTTPSPVIAEYLAKVNPNVWIVPNTVPEWLTHHTMPARPHPTLGIQASDSHLGDITEPVIRSLNRFFARHEDWDMNMYGHLFGPAQVTNRFHHIPWKSTVDDFYRTVTMDVGIGPLRDTRFNRAKSSLRAIEYAALGIVAVLPDLPLYRGWVEDGVTGRLVGPSRTLAAVLNEIADPYTRRQMASAARARAAGWTTEANIGRWLEAWHSL
jgi:hypothetical protein